MSLDKYLEGAELVGRLVEANQNVKEFYAPYIEKAVEAASYGKWFDTEDYEGPWAIDLVQAEYGDIVFVSETNEEYIPYGGSETHGGAEIRMTPELLADPDKFVADAKLEKEIRERDDNKIAVINARNKVARLEKELEKARKEMSGDE